MSPRDSKSEAAVKPLDATQSEIERIVRAESSDPFHFLGPHWLDRDGKRVLAIRAYHPAASEMAVEWLPNSPKRHSAIAAEKIHPGGVFEAVVPSDVGKLRDNDEIAPTSYRLKFKFADGNSLDIFDAYAFLPLLTDYDLYLSGEGTHYQKYEKLGAHVREVAGVSGVHFGVWAPNALRVSVVGNFNFWDGRIHPMRLRGETGIWELFIPGLDEGTLYKFEIKSRAGFWGLKSDPYGFAAEKRPNNASVVVDIDKHQWNDAAWLTQRASRDWLHSPMSIYEVHLGSWRRRRDEGNRWLTYRELADELISYVKGMGYTHIEMMPVMEHPLDKSWGYQTVGYFAVTSRFGTPDDFMYFVDRCHQEGIGVILDWTPAHFPRDAHGLAFFDGTHLYEHADPRKGAHPDWGTLVFNYGRNEVQNFLISNALFWIDKYHLDGLRVDAVASMLYLDYSRKAGEWIPNRFGGRENLEAIRFLKHLNEVLHTQHPGALTIAEESTSWPAVSRPVYLGGLGFDLKWNMGWMNDTLRFMEYDPIHRKYHHNELTFSMIYAFTENFILPLSHDEVVHGKRSLLEKMPGDDWQKFANLRLLFGYMWAHPGKKLLFMGSELAKREEFWDEDSVDWRLEDSPPHRGIQQLMSDLNRLHVQEPALHELDFEWAGFEWIEANDATNSVIAFQRRARNQENAVVVVCNFTPVVRDEYRVGVPRPGYYREILNTDSGYYWGSGAGNAGGVNAEPIPWNGKPWSINLRLPPLAASYFKCPAD
ncbi:MAG: 1,4-alpha-glucan branching protein GlgB [Candidatus Acidiferrales bacterium]